MVNEEKLIKVMDYIRKFSEENGYTPSVREIGKECGIKSTATVHSYIEKLQNKGYLNKTDKVCDNCGKCIDMQDVASIKIDKIYMNPDEYKG